MAGLTTELIGRLSKEQAISRTRRNIHTDFIYAPQYNLVLETLSDELWAELENRGAS